MDFTDWLDSPLGLRCLEIERELVRDALDCVFGEQLLQVGVWGRRDAFLPFARTQRSALVAESASQGNVDLVSSAGQLAIASDSIDAIFLPHTLERSSSAHALLRESARVLRGDGHLIVLGFRPAGPWGLRHLFDPGGYPPGSLRMIREGRLTDWLELLSFDVDGARGYCHALPFERVARLAGFASESWARRWLPIAAAGYLLVARKRVVRLTPVRPAWRRARLRAVRGLVEPAARASRTRQTG